MAFPRPMNRNLKLDLQYIGTRYRGWQSQPDGRTIQDHLQGALEKILQQPVAITGAGRTDAGVHARGQVAHFVTGSPMPAERILRGANALLPADIRVTGIREVPIEFHACRDAVTKHYAYRFAVGEVVSPFAEPFVHHVRGGADVDRMARGADLLVGEHDFSSFCAAECAVQSRVRRIVLSRVENANGDGIAIFRVAANGFLQHMVRNLAGTLIEIGRHRMEPDRIPAILAARDRRAAGPCAPAKGLTLERVDYGERR
jgi:tRNA pseudouridine38-40 synthase